MSPNGNKIKIKSKSQSQDQKQDQGPEPNPALKRTRGVRLLFVAGLSRRAA